MEKSMYKTEIGFTTAPMTIEQLIDYWRETNSVLSEGFPSHRQEISSAFSTVQQTNQSEASTDGNLFVLRSALRPAPYLLAPQRNLTGRESPA